MKTVMKSAGLALPFFVVLALTVAPSGGLTTVFAHEGPTEFIGFGVSKAISTIETNMLKGGTKVQESFGKKDLGAIGDTVGNSFTFAFGAIKDANGDVQGQMFVRDHALNLTISSDVVELVPHPKHRAPVGVKAHGLNYALRMGSSTSSVVVNGKLKPGWYLRNGPTWDGEKDIVCFGLYDPTGKKAYQWIGFLSAGDVMTK